MRKLLLILVLSGVLLVMSGGSVLSLDCCVSNDCCDEVKNEAGETISCECGSAAGYVCEGAETGCQRDEASAIDNDCNGRFSNGDGRCEGVVGGGTTGGPVEGPAECIEVKHKIIIDLAKGDGSGVWEDVVFEKGVIVSEKPVNSTECGNITAACAASQGPHGEGAGCYAKEFGIIVLLNTIYTVTDWMFYILTLVVVLMVIYGGFVILTASGSPEKAGKGKGILTYAIIGLAVALLAKIIPSLVKFIMGV